MIGLVKLNVAGQSHSKVKPDKRRSRQNQKNISGGIGPDLQSANLPDPNTHYSFFPQAVSRYS